MERRTSLTIECPVILLGYIWIDEEKDENKEFSFMMMKLSLFTRFQRVSGTRVTLSQYINTGHSRCKSLMHQS